MCVCVIVCVCVCVHAHTLSALYVSRMRLQGHNYRIWDDPER